MGFTLVDLHKVAYKDKPFVMAEQAKHVFYVQDPSDSRWSMVLQGRTSCISHQNDDSTVDICETPSVYTHMAFITEEHEVDDVHANHNDHDEGLWENIHTQLHYIKVMFMILHNQFFFNLHINNLLLLYNLNINNLLLLYNCN